MKLYGSLTSPFVRKVRIVLAEKQLPCEFVVTEPGRVQAVAHLNPLGRVPVLELDESATAPSVARGPRLDPIGDGDVLFDSPVIVEYLDALSAPALIPASGPARWQVLRWHALAQGVLDATVARLLETRRPAAQQSGETIALHENAIRAALDYAEARVAGRHHLVEGRLTLADLAWAVALEYVDFRFAHDWRSTHPQLARWLGPWSARTSFQATQPPR
jgi:glutathione S-transferase